MNSMMPRYQLYGRLSEASGVGVGGYLTVTAVFTTFYLRSQKGKKQRTTFYKTPKRDILLVSHFYRIFTRFLD
jgi:hypothetical protein